MTLSRSWTKEEDAILYSLYGKIKIRDLGLNRDPSVIIKRAKKLNIIVDSYRYHSLVNKKYWCDEGFFKIPNILNSYWAGFIAADGCICERDRSLICVMKLSDKFHLERFVQSIQYTGIIKENKSSGFTSDLYARLVIHGIPSILRDLDCNFNITPHKTFTLRPPNLICLEHRAAYFAGYIDGDGSIYIKNSNNQPTISVGGRKILLDWFKELINHKMGIHEHSKIRKVKDEKSFYEYKINGFYAKEVSKFINKLDLPLLERKWKNVKN